MRNTLVMYPIRRLTIPTGRRKINRDGYSKMLGKLDAASNRLARSRRRR
jgi:hypothetical protein